MVSVSKNSLSSIENIFVNLLWIPKNLLSAFFILFTFTPKFKAIAIDAVALAIFANGLVAYFIKVG